MSLALETALVAVLKGRCQQVHPVTAPFGTPAPYVIWQHVGGAPWAYVEGAVADKRHAVVQINVWATTVAEALTLLRDIEADLRGHPSLVAQPSAAEPFAQAEPDINRYGFTQDFAIVGDR